MLHLLKYITPFYYITINQLQDINMNCIIKTLRLQHVSIFPRISSGRPNVI